MEFPYFEKYKLRITKNAGSISFGGYPQDKNGLILGIISGKETMRHRYFGQLSLSEEIRVIEGIIERGNSFDRYPLRADIGQICLYRDNSYIYDIMNGPEVIEREDVFSDEWDNKTENDPILVIPTIDMLNIIIEYNQWVQNGVLINLSFVMLTD